MSSSDRRSLLFALAALPLAGCGFRPAFAPGGPAADLFDRVAIEPPADKNGFDLVERLEERLGRTHAPAYRLGYRIETRVTPLAITSSNAGETPAVQLARGTGSFTCAAIRPWTSLARYGGIPVRHS